MATTQIEMLWDCPSCGTRGIGGRYKRCTVCNAPIPSGVQWYMPKGAAELPGITDPELLTQATAGADWHCPHCGSSQRNDRGKCQECGASRRMTKDEGVVQQSSPACRYHSRHASGSSFYSRVNRVVLAILVGIAVVVAILTILLRFYERTVEVQVVSVNWTHTIHVDRWQVIHNEGFNEDRPLSAFNVESKGMKHHHYIQVPDGFKTEYHAVRVQCGESCYTTSRRCTSNGNGFSTCSGGNRVCRPRYCSEQKPRQVQKYRDESVEEKYYSWDVWDWKQNRNIAVSGTTTKTSWPSKKRICLDCNVGKGEKERTSQKAEYEVTLSDGEKTYNESSMTLEEFETFSLGSRHLIKVDLLGKVKGRLTSEKKN